MRTLTYRGYEIVVYPENNSGVIATVKYDDGVLDSKTLSDQPRGNLHSEVFELKYIAAKGCRDERTQFRTSREAARLAIGRCRVWINNRSTLQQGINQAVDQAVHDGEVAE